MPREITAAQIPSELEAFKIWIKDLVPDGVDVSFDDEAKERLTQGLLPLLKKLAEAKDVDGLEEVLRVPLRLFTESEFKGLLNRHNANAPNARVQLGEIDDKGHQRVLLSHLKQPVESQLPVEQWTNASSVRIPDTCYKNVDGIQLADLVMPDFGNYPFVIRAHSSLVQGKVGWDEIKKTAIIPKSQSDLTRTLTTDASTIRFLERKGHRPSQEDVGVIGSVAANGRSMKERLAAAFAKTIEITAEQTAGSTATMVVVEPATAEKPAVITTANIGDSRVVAYVWDPKTKKVTPQMLTQDHKPHVLAERLRVEALQGESLIGYEVVRPGVVAGRVNGMLSMSRCLGQSELGESIGKEPDITEHDVSKLMTDEGQRVFIATSCDGLFERGIRPEHYAGILQKTLSEGYEGEVADVMLAYSLQQPYDGEDEWYERKRNLRFTTSDNLTLAWSEVTPLLRAPAPAKAERKSLYMAVFDGNGGNTVSKMAADSMAQEMGVEPAEEKGVWQKREEARAVERARQSVPVIMVTPADGGAWVSKEERRKGNQTADSMLFL